MALRVSLCVELLLAWPLDGLAQAKAPNKRATRRPAATKKTQVYAGGVAGITDLLEPKNSKSYRTAGGGLYVHNSGWGVLSRQQKEQVLNVFKGSPIAIEIGYGDTAMWATSLKANYLDLGIKPEFVCANAFAEGNEPSEGDWTAFSKAIRGAGLPEATAILPTFEYQNFGKNQPTLLDNRISAADRFQAIIRQSGGLVVDAPPGYFLYEREPAYREWVVDAIQWANLQRLKTVLIVSPHKSGRLYQEHTRQMLAFLSLRSALPTAIVSENYVEGVASDYPNVVGSEHKPATTLGVGRWLQKTK